jgi:hypothetical protein
MGHTHVRGLTMLEMRRITGAHSTHAALPLKPM